MSIATMWGARMATFKERFLMLKIDKDVSLEKIAKHVHINRSTLSRIVSGQLSLKYEMLNSLAEYFDVDKAYLLGESDIPRNKEKPNVTYYEVIKEFEQENIPIDAIKQFIQLYKTAKHRG